MQGGAQGGVKRSKKRRGGKKRKRRGGGGGGPARRMGPPRRRPKGYCMCPACGTKVAVYAEVPCYIMNCAKCGSTMVKETGNNQHPQGLPQDLPDED